MDYFYDRINDYTAVSIRLASPEEIRSWSYGEVRKPETINYRTYKPERDGLFCERIFGPQKDWECFCGKYRGIKYKGVICDRCGVEITHSRVRRKRMGHINLASPVVHIWFFKIIPSRIGTLLNLRISQLEQVVYYQSYLITDIDEKKCEKDLRNYLNTKKIISETEYKELKEKWGNIFEAGMGAEAIRKLLKSLNLPKIADEIRADIRKTSSVQKVKDLSKRLKIVESFLSTGSKPEWMVLDVVPVIPADLRPIVQLESGNFASSDLNELYRRLVYRNNRLKRMIDINAPEIIIRSEKRILQQAVDALFDNTRCKRPILGSNNRPLKSLADMIKGKQGRFRENLLGKRVDYSARSVIVIGPELKLNQCGLPKTIALELYQPFIIKRLKELGKVDTIRSAKRMIERREECVWDILDEVVKDKPVLLNRAPTLHRMGIQAFDPLLIDGKAIQIHPLVCPGFNADFDGDQMAVHLPLSYEAQIEAKTLMMSTLNVFSPASGNAITMPTQDIVLGCHYISIALDNQKGENKTFSDSQEVMFAYQSDKVDLHAKIYLKLPKSKIVVDRNGRVETSENCRYYTTVGRVIFNFVLPEQMPFYNCEIDKKVIGMVIKDCSKFVNYSAVLNLLDNIKELGFKYITLSGMSLAVEDLKVPQEKWKIISQTEKEINKIEENYKSGILTKSERYNQIIDLWTKAREDVSEVMMKTLKEDTRNNQKYINPIYVMCVSGARGSIDQVRQLAGMRGLMAKPSGQIIESPIKANFKEGLSVHEYFSSTHGARKGLADTALKTADAGYLTRKLVDVSQHIVISTNDCGTLGGITKSVIYKGDKIEVPLSKSIYGRTARDTIVDLVSDKVVVKEGDLITDDIAKKIEELGYQKIRVRSPLTCEAEFGICAKCYGMDLSRGELVEEGLPVGIIAAQSIGEPGTQLTMRTFHIGGTAARIIEEAKIATKSQGFVKYNNIKFTIVKKEKTHSSKILVLNRNGEIVILDEKNRELERYQIQAGSYLSVEDGQKVKPRQLIAEWDPHNIPIIAEKDGYIKYEDIELGTTIKEELDQKSGIKRKMVIEHKGDKHPQILVLDEKETILAVYTIPENAYIEVEEGEYVEAGKILAKVPREVRGTQDITGGLPRVTELVEARKPKDPAIISDIDGIVEFGEKKKGRRVIVVKNLDTGMTKEHHIPRGKHLRVHRGDSVKAGEPLTEGPLVLQDLLRVSGIEVVQDYIMREIQSVYRSQNVIINDKHIELIIAQMLNKVKISDAGDTRLLLNTIVHKVTFKRENERFILKSGKPATAKPLLLGITKAALQSESFVSAASFQETTRILTDASIEFKRDELRGLKENVILGHIIPAGTGYKKYLNMKVTKNIVLVKEGAAVAS